MSVSSLPLGKDPVWLPSLHTHLSHFLSHSGPSKVTWSQPRSQICSLNLKKPSDGEVPKCWQPKKLPFALLKVCHLQQGSLGEKKGGKSPELDGLGWGPLGNCTRVRCLHCSAGQATYTIQDSGCKGYFRSLLKQSRHLISFLYFGWWKILCGAWKCIGRFQKMNSNCRVNWGCSSRAWLLGDLQQLGAEPQGMPFGVC